MSRVGDRQGTKARWRKGESSAYGIAAHRREKAAQERAQQEHTAKIEREKGS